MATSDGYFNDASLSPSESSMTYRTSSDEDDKRSLRSLPPYSPNGYDDPADARFVNIVVHDDSRQPRATGAEYHTEQLQSFTESTASEDSPILPLYHDNRNPLLQDEVQKRLFEQHELSRWFLDYMNKEKKRRHYRFFTCRAIGFTFLVAFAIHLMYYAFVSNSVHSVMPWCPSTSVPFDPKGTIDYTFPESLGHEFTFKQQVVRNSSSWDKHPKVKGDVILIADDVRDLSVELEIRLSEESLREAISIHVGDTGLIIETHDVDGARHPYLACINIQARIRIPLSRSFNLSSLTLFTDTMNDRLDSSMAIVKGIEAASFTVKAGNIKSDSEDHSSAFSATYLSAYTVAGNIDGWFGVDARLSLNTTSGNIDASVIPTDRNSAAVFQASTKSGNVKVDFRTTKSIPRRDFQTVVTTTNGNIAGRYYLGSFLKLTTVNGNIDPHIYASGAASAELSSESTHGNTNLQFLGSLADDSADAPAHLISKHGTINGNVRILYPRDWEGNVLALVDFGSLNMEGKDLRIVEDQKTFGGRKMKGEKGDASASESTVRSVHGNVRVCIGQVSEACKLLDRRSIFGLQL